MESANLYKHHQHQLLLYSSLPPSSSSSPYPGISDWKQADNVVLDGYEFNKYMTEILPNSPSAKNPLFQEMKFGNVNIPLANNEVQFENIIKGSKSSDSNFLNSYRLINGEISFARYGAVAPAAAAATSFIRSSCTDHNCSELYDSNSLLISSSSPSLQLAGDHILSYNTNQVVKGSNRSFEERNSLSYFHVQQSNHSPSNSSNKTSKFRNETYNSRTGKLSACSSIHEVVAKKPRLSSSPYPTLKVRKEKLGDRIAALHRMVSPFGKTDTASVLTEAIGYVQFLQDQIQTLTLSYLKSSRNKSSRNTRGDSTMKDDDHQKEDEPKIYQDLRSRGLCLVPISFTSYICSYNGNIC